MLIESRPRNAAVPVLYLTKVGRKRSSTSHGKTQEEEEVPAAGRRCAKRRPARPKVYGHPYGCR